MCTYVCFIVSSVFVLFCFYFVLFSFCFVFVIFLIFVQKCMWPFTNNSSEWLHLFYIWKVYGLISMLQAWDDEDPDSPYMRSSWRREGLCKSNAGTECFIFNIRTQSRLTVWRIKYKAAGIIFFISSRRCACNFIYCRSGPC